MDVLHCGTKCNSRCCEPGAFGCRNIHRAEARYQHSTQVSSLLVLLHRAQCGALAPPGGDFFGRHFEHSDGREPNPAFETMPTWRPGAHCVAFGHRHVSPFSAIGGTNGEAAEVADSGSSLQRGGTLRLPVNYYKIFQCYPAVYRRCYNKIVSVICTR